jgi:uncharacterized membrane protein HdeD (DUF308 family)
MIVTNPFSPGTWSRDQIDTVSRNWWVLLLNGVVGIVAGGIILSTDWTVSELAVFVGAVLLVQGILTAFSVPLDGSGHAWAVALGLLEAFIGLAVWIWPGPTLLVVAFFIGWYVLFSGIVTIAGSISSRDVLPYWGFVLGFGILETLLSLWLLARPGLTLVTAVLVLGLWALVYGIVQVVLSFEAKNLSARADRVDHELQAVTDPEPLDTAVRR